MSKNDYVPMSKDYYCPCCGSIVKARAMTSHKIQPHFYHNGGGSCSQENIRTLSHLEPAIYSYHRNLERRKEVQKNLKIIENIKNLSGYDDFINDIQNIIDIYNSATFRLYESPYSKRFMIYIDSSDFDSYRLDLLDDICIQDVTDGNFDLILSKITKDIENSRDKRCKEIQTKTEIIKAVEVFRDKMNSHKNGVWKCEINISNTWVMVEILLLQDNIQFYINFNSYYEFDKEEIHNYVENLFVQAMESLLNHSGEDGCARVLVSQFNKVQEEVENA